MSNRKSFGMGSSAEAAAVLPGGFGRCLQGVRGAGGPCAAAGYMTEKHQQGWPMAGWLWRATALWVQHGCEITLCHTASSALSVPTPDA